MDISLKSMNGSTVK